MALSAGFFTFQNARSERLKKKRGRWTTIFQERIHVIFNDFLNQDNEDVMWRVDGGTERCLLGSLDLTLPASGWFSSLSPPNNFSIHEEKNIQWLRELFFQVAENKFQDRLKGFEFFFEKSTLPMNHVDVWLQWNESSV